MLKTLLIAGTVLTAGSAYSLTFSPSAIYDAGTFGNQPALFPGFTHQSFSGTVGNLSSDGIGISSELTITSSSVTLDGSITVSPEGWYGYTSFYGQFTLTEASYVSGFGTGSGDSSDPNAYTKVSVTIGSLTESQLQSGSIPSLLDLGSNALISLGNGDIHAPRLLAAGTYLFELLIEAGDKLPEGNTLSFTAEGSAGFSVVSAPDGGATGAMLGVGLFGFGALRRKLRK